MERIRNGSIWTMFSIIVRSSLRYWRSTIHIATDNLDLLSLAVVSSVIMLHNLPEQHLHAESNDWICSRYMHCPHCHSEGDGQGGYRV